MSTHTDRYFSRKSSGRSGHGIRLNQTKRMPLPPLSVRFGEADQQNRRVATGETERIRPDCGTTSAFGFPVPRKQPLTQAAKTKIRRKADHADHKDAGEDSLGAKRLLRLRHHVAGFLDGDVETDPHRPWRGPCQSPERDR